MTSPLCLRGGRVLDPSDGIDRSQDLWIDQGRIAGWGEDAPAALRSRPDVEIVDVRGAIVCPGLVDIHVHLREPGQEDKETIETGTRAAVRGGFTAVACMPNTDPPLDERPRVEYVVRRAREVGLARVFPIAAVTFLGIDYLFRLTASGLQGLVFCFVTVGVQLAICEGFRPELAELRTRSSKSASPVPEVT